MSRQALGLHLEVVLILPEAQLEKEAGEHKGGCFFLCTRVSQGGKSFARLGEAGEGSREGPSWRGLTYWKIRASPRAQDHGLLQAQTARQVSIPFLLGATPCC